MVIAWTWQAVFAVCAGDKDNCKIRDLKQECKFYASFKLQLGILVKECGGGSGSVCIRLNKR